MFKDHKPKAGRSRPKDQATKPAPRGGGSLVQAARAPSISLPKGGGAFKNIGEKFAANPVTGTGNMTVPLTTSPGRSGFGPQLSLSYDSGAGNGPFGFGWNLSLSSITRKTEKGLPEYRDADESDVFILSGAEDLVPVLSEVDGEWVREVLPPRTIDGENFTVQRYRPRIEGQFARIERWTNQQTGESFWRSISRDNITTVYGKNDSCRVFDPIAADAGQPPRVFSWLVCESYDDKGNAIVYEYTGENDANVDQTLLSERNRQITANRYLKSIKYGNRTSRLVQPDLTQMQWMFEVVFDYDEAHYEDVDLDLALPEDEQHRFVRASLSPGAPWSVRADAFSKYRSGFEVRSYRRCHRVLMFHRFSELGSEPCLVNSTEFDYRDLDYSQLPTLQTELEHEGSTRFASFIQAVTQSGYVRDVTKPVLESNGARYVTYRKSSLPPLEFAYSKASIQQDIRELDSKSLENLPIGIDGTVYQWVDLDGEGISGILTDQADGWFYKRGLGNGRFGDLELVVSKPSLADLGSGPQKLLDLGGDGRLELVSFSGPAPGFYERTEDENWEMFKTFPALPHVRWDKPNLLFVDLNGDGRTDVLIAEDEVLTWYPSLAERGFESPRYVRQTLDDELGPRLLTVDDTQAVYLADMSGDGLTDLVRIRNGEICYWPNLGYGRFGAKVSMDNAPRFDNPDQFNHRKVRIADIDGSGTSDIIYLGREGVDLYFNQSGNRWSDAHRLDQFPTVDNVSSVMTADLLGNGTVCLVWSSPLQADAGRQLLYMDLMGGQKPHLLVKAKNNLGSETVVHYVSSTHFYLADRAAGLNWITKLPFPVHVVERTETFDRISGNRFITRYAYHHGYFDGTEREFRGFGLVEQWDTEEFAALNENQAPVAATNIDESSHVPPMLTRTWFHTGAYVERDQISDLFAGSADAQLAGQYYREPALTPEQAQDLLLPNTVLPENLPFEEEVESCRALKGFMLRQEVYALDGSELQSHPYSVSEQNFTVRSLQPRGPNRHAVFFTKTREGLFYHYERNPTDPRVTHTLTLEFDKFGNNLKEASIGYGRRENVLVINQQGQVEEIPNPGLAQLSELDQETQTATLITYTENEFTNPIAAADDYRTPLFAEARTYQLTGLALSPGQSRFTLDEVLNAGKTAAPLDYEEDTTSGVKEKRLIEHVRTLYRADNLTGALLPGQVESKALLFESYKLAFTPGLVTSRFNGRVTDLMLELEGRYVHSNGDANWWVPLGRVFYSPDAAHTAAEELDHARAHFFLPYRYRDPFHTNAISTESLITYDAHDLLVVETRDPLGNRVTAGERDAGNNLLTVENDYRVLQPRLVMDANRNRAAAVFDTLGAVVGTAVMGKPEDNPQRGDSLSSDFPADLTRAELNQYFSDPTGPFAATLLGDASSRIIYDLTAYWREPDVDKKPPVFVATLARETHTSAPVPAGGLKIQHSFTYADGFGREIQKKLMAEAGPVPQRDPAGNIVIGADGQPQMTPGDVTPRWTGSGWTILDNKGKPVRQYEPFFTDTHRFEFDIRIGVSPVIFYDALGRVVGTLHPNHTWEKTVFDPWQQVSWDVNDTVLVSDPKTDPNLGDFFRRQPEPNYLPTWFDARQGGALGPQEQTAAIKASLHAATPTIAHADSLGRTVHTVAHNRFKYSDTPAGDPPINEFLSTRVVFDLEGNELQVIDANERVVMRYEYDMLGGRVRQSSIDAGERWTFSDVGEKVLYAWDSKDHQFRNTYDPLRRPADSFVKEGAGTEQLVGRVVYGESVPNAEAGNFRGHIVQIFDQAGVVTTDEYDFKGNALSTTRQFAESYSTTLDWSVAVPLAESYTSSTVYDALNRATELISPDNTVVRPTYNEANLVERLVANLHGAVDATEFVTDVDYDAKGQRTMVAYGNGVTTNYQYDKLTYRLIHLLTQRNPVDFPDDCPQPFPSGWPGCEAQNLHYTYDPAGNLTHIRDDAQQTIYFHNQRVEPGSEYTYDALYRLIEATGREHLGQAGGNPIPHSYNDKPRVRILLSASDGNAMGRYLERYVYDAVGNFLEMIHRGSDLVVPGWTRTYNYAEESLLEPGKVSNRLTSTTIGAQTESYSTSGNGYDAHGNMLRMPQLQTIQWDFQDQLQMTQRQAVNATDDDGVAQQGERTWYVYNHEGQRVRKVTEFAGGQIKEERIYVGTFELYRRHGANSLERETLHIMDDKRRVALVETRISGNEPGVPQQLIRYQYGNHIGSASLELDHQAQIISYEEYTPYGSTSYQAVRSQTETPKRYCFTGKERDDESGLYYHGARYYIPWLARWTSADPAGLIDGPNVYVYARNRPTTVTDPQGTQGLDLSEQTVLNGVDTMLKQKGVAYSTEVTVKITLPNGTVVIRRYDRFYMDPATNKWVGVEAKGAKIDKLTAAQELADKWVQEKGGKFEVVKGATKPPGTAKVSGVPLQPGFKGSIDPGNLTYVHGKAGNPAATPGKPNMMHIDAWKQGISQQIPNAAQPPNTVMKSTPNAPPSYVPRQGVMDDYKKNAGKPKQSVDITDPKNRPAKPPAKPAPPPEVPPPVESPPPAKPSAGARLKGAAGGTAKAVAPMVVTWGLNYFRLKNYNEAAELREQYSGTVTQEMKDRQERAGWEFTGEYDEQGRPKWKYNPKGALKLREMIFYILDPFQGAGDPNSHPVCPYPQCT